MKHTSQSIREALEAGKRVLLAGDRLWIGQINDYPFEWRGMCYTGTQFDNLLRELQDKVEIVEPEPLSFRSRARKVVGPPPIRFTKCEVLVPLDWDGEGVVVIKESDLPEALKQLEALTTKEEEARPSHGTAQHPSIKDELITLVNAVREECLDIQLHGPTREENNNSYWSGVGALKDAIRALDLSGETPHE